MPAKRLYQPSNPLLVLYVIAVGDQVNRRDLLNTLGFGPMKLWRCFATLESQYGVKISVKRNIGPHEARNHFVIDDWGCLKKEVFLEVFAKYLQEYEEYEASQQ